MYIKHVNNRSKFSASGDHAVMVVFPSDFKRGYLSGKELDPIGSKFKFEVII